MAIILRTVKGSELTFAEVDGNFQSLFYSSSFDGTNLVLYTTGSTSQSIDLSTLTVDTGSLMITGSILNGTLTFTKGDGSTFNLVYNTGSFSGSFEGDGSGLTSLNHTSSLQNVLDEGSTATLTSGFTQIKLEDTATRYHDLRILDSEARLYGQFDATNFSQIKAEYGNAQMFGINGSNSSQINVNSQINLEISTTSGSTSFEIRPDSNLFTDGINSKGLEYGANYSSNFTTRSLVDKEYVDTQITASSTGSFTGSFTGDGSGLTGITASYNANALTTASAEFAEITFTKGDGSTFLIDSTPRQVIETVKNLESGTLVKGTPVYASGSTGNAIHVYAASSSRSDRMPAAYILNQDLTSGQEGEGLLLGFINGVDTSAFASGDVVYVGADGGYTNVKPTGSNLIQNLGKVTISAVNGSGVISGAGRANDVPNITAGYIWIGDSNGVATPTATSSIQNVVSSSYASTASYVETAQTASYVDLVAGPNVTINQVGTSFEISSSGGAGGSSLWTASGADNIHDIVGNQSISESHFGFIAGGITGSIVGTTGSVILGGSNNSISSSSTFHFQSIMGGSSNSIWKSPNSAIIGGYGSTMIDSNDSFMAGGQGNEIGDHTGIVAIIGGRLQLITGSLGTAANYSGIFQGDENTILSGSRVTILGGLENLIEGSNGSSIVGGAYHEIKSGGSSVILGGSRGDNFASRTAIIGGDRNVITNGANDSAIMASSASLIEATALRSAVIGGFQLTASAADTVYVPNLVATGSITGDGSGLTGIIQPPTVATQDVIPFMNSLGTGAEYQDFFKFDGTSLWVGEDANNYCKINDATGAITMLDGGLYNLTLSPNNVSGGGKISSTTGAIWAQASTAGSYQLWLDKNNKRIGIYTSTPDATLTIQGEGSDSTTSALKIKNNSLSTLLEVKDDGTISGSVFSGSFVGDGSGLTGVITNTYFTESANSIALDTGATTRDVLEINTNNDTTFGGTYSIGNIVVGNAHTIGSSGNLIRRSMIGGSSNNIGQLGTFQDSIVWGGWTTNTVSDNCAYSAGFGSGILNGDYNFLGGYNNSVYGNNNVVIGQTSRVGASGTFANNSIAIGNNAVATNDNQIVIGNTVTTNATYAAAPGIYLAWGTSRPTTGFFVDPTIGQGLNFAVGGNNTLRTDLGIMQSGSGAGILYLANYTDNNITEPTSDMSDAVALWAKDRTANVKGLIVKAENGGKSWIGDRIGVNTTTPSASLHAVGEGSTSATTALLIEDSGSVNELFKITDDGAVYGIPGAMLAMTELTAAALVTHTVTTSTTATVINLNSDATTRLAKASFVAPPSGNVLVRIEFDAVLTNSATNLRIGLHNANASTTTPTEGWFRINGDQDGSSASYFAEFKITGLTPGTTYNRYFVASSDFSGVTIRASQQQTGAIAVSDLPSPLRIKTYDLGAISITSNPTS